MPGNIILCGCGCGKITTDKTDKYKPRRYISGHSMRGRNHWNYGRGRHGVGREITKDGYVSILVNYAHPRKHNGKVLEHILIMEKKMGRFINKDEVIHHINGNKQDNRIENLELLQSQTEHISIHGSLKPRSSTQKCTRCGSFNTVKQGHCNKKQYFSCHDCKKWFHGGGFLKG